jgi:hypothetical protein
MRTFVFVPLVLLLAACNPAYQRSTAPATAKIRFTAGQHKGYLSSMSVYAHDNETCGTPKKVVGLGGGMWNWGGGKKARGDIGMAKDPAVQYVIGQYYETTVEAGKRFHFTVTGGEDYKVCYVSASLLPEAGNEYEVTYTTSQAMCRLKLEKIALQDASLIRVREASGMQRDTPCTFFWN